jgi:hypothetical protein
MLAYDEVALQIWQAYVCSLAHRLGDLSEMPAKEHPASHPTNEPSPTHNWNQPDGRRFDLQPGKTVIQWSCTACGRNFVHDLGTEEWYAALPRVLGFERVDGVSKRWLAENCSGKFQSVDEQARQLRRAS